MPNRFDFQLDSQQLERELNEFRSLLSSHVQLAERDDILPFFRSRHNLSALVGLSNASVACPDKIAFEFTLFGSFVCDLVVCDSVQRAVCLVEFEDAKSGSIFKKGKRLTSEWSWRFEHGWSQIFDWYYILEDLKQTNTIRDTFGFQVESWMGLLIIGRDQFLSDSERDRLG